MILSVWLSVLILIITIITVSSKFDRNDESNSDKKLNLAFCLTGQLARLELLSKINNIFIANAQKGNRVDVFVLLDNNAEEVYYIIYIYINNN